MDRTRAGEPELSPEAILRLLGESGGVTRGAQSVSEKAASPEERLRMEVERLRAENDRLKNQKTAVRLQVSQKGGVSLYGLGRYPVTLYKEQWLRLLTVVEEIRIFIKEHEAELSSKSASKGRDTSE